jgi:carbon storage regulator
MLVLSRTVGQRVALDMPDGTRVWVMISDVDRGRVRVGFDAPKSVTITREELLRETPAKGAT